MEEPNFFDNLIPEAGDTKHIADELKAKHEHLDYLIHKVFQQSEDGRELLTLWKEALIMKPGVEPGSDYIQIGINEGVNRFIRNIILTVKRTEES